MNKRNCFFSLLIALILILAGCSPEMMAEPKGTLEVVISGGSKDIHPTISLDTAYYKLHAESDGGETLEATLTSAEGPYTNSSVPAGSWAINVSAYNGDDIEIGKGSASATVEAGKKATAVVSIKELEGKGTLKVVLIGASAGNSYTLNVYSALDISEPMVTEAFKAAGDGLALEVSLDNGFYVFDVACSNSMIKLPIKVAVRIVKGDTVTAEYSVSENGSVEIAIRNDIAPTPSLSVGLSSGKIGPVEAVEAVAVASNIGTDGLKYEWYMDGIKLDASGSSIELGYEDVGSGIHTISCLISNSEGVLWSDSAEIDGGEDEPGYIPTYGTSETHPYLAITEDGAIYCIDKSIREANIPDYFNGTRVASFAPAAFKNCNRLESVIIPKTITQIGECIPDYCHITKVYDGSVDYEELDRIIEESMGNGVFAGCTSLKAVEIPESVTTVGACSFMGCTSLSDVKLPSKLESICMGAFMRCSDLETITIPDTVTEIGLGAFSSCSSLSQITIPDSVIIFGFAAFEYGALTSITIPDSVTEIGDAAFRHCSSLSAILIKEGVTEIGSYAFECCSITSITIPDNVTSIGNYAFFYSSLESITIPDSVTYIGNDAFYGCSSLESIYINNEIFSIPGMPWGAENATVYWNNEIAETHPHLTINSDGAVRCIDETITEAVIPEFVNGAKVTSIDLNAFYQCSSLKSVTIPDFVTAIGNSAFEGCSSLESIYISNDIFSIPGMPWGAENATVYWNNEIAETHPYLTIDSYGAVRCIDYTITEAVIPEYVNGAKVTSFDYDAFRFCSSLTEITIPDSVTEIRSYSFCDCSSLTSITIPNSVTHISSSAFSGCSSLTEITIPDSVTYIGNYAFYSCSSLESIYIDQYEGSLDISDAGIPSGVVIYWKTE